MVRVLLADDHQILRDGVRRGLEGAGEEVVGEASDGEQAVELARATNPDVILMDISMPVLDGIEATRRITAEVPGARIVVLTMHDDVTRTCRHCRRRRRIPDQGHVVRRGPPDDPRRRRR